MCFLRKCEKKYILFKLIYEIPCYEKKLYSRNKEFFFVGIINLEKRNLLSVDKRLDLELETKLFINKNLVI